MHCALWGFWTLLITGIRGGVTKIPVLCFLFSKHVLLCFFVWGGGGGRWGGGRSCCHNKGLIWLIFTVFFHVKISRIFVWLFFTHTRFYFHVWVFKEIFTHTFLFSRTVFQKFSRKENKFHGWKAKNSRKFSRKAFWFSREKKSAEEVHLTVFRL